MIEIDIPGEQTITIEHVVMDYNGTLAQDGQLIEGLVTLFYQLAPTVTLHVVTSDTFGQAAQQLLGLPCQVRVLEGDHADVAKLEYARSLGLENVCAMGNGRNDRLMIQQAELGIVVIQREGAAWDAVEYADVICTSTADALALLANPRRLVATLRG
ncbi:MAG: hypothetical protein R3300_08040 [Candidatus Promineifilaceae bacterium]|nr:hypothetical protein [Candidatus Promineifilaceae bacterium]